MSDTKSIILPTFSGKDEAFQLWWTKFRAFATAKGVIAALLGKEDALPATESTIVSPPEGTQDDGEWKKALHWGPGWGFHWD